MSRLVHVVGIGQHSESQFVSKAQQEATPQPSLLGAAGCFHVGDVALAVFVLQVYVHHIATRIDIVAQRLTPVCLLLINLQVFHRVIRQVLHQHLLISTEERARAQ